MILFKNPILLILLPLALPLLLWWKKKEKPPGLLFPSEKTIKDLPRTWKIRFSALPFLLRLVAVALFIIAWAGPRSVLEEAQYTSEGIDIMLTVDVSLSMAAEDFFLKGKRLNRLAVVKEVVSDFIDGRENDRLGLIAFAGEAFTVCPLTRDHGWLQENLKRIDFNLIKDGTAIGSALSSALLRLRQSPAKSKVVVLFTDGVNNSGQVAPLEAADAAKALGVRVYTIGAGSKGYAPYPVTDIFGRQVYQRVLTDVDEETLREIATRTGAQFFRATDTESLRRIYQEIDKLEKTEIQETGYRKYKELFVYFLAAALAVLLAEYFLANTVLRKGP